ncbi:MAG: DEAD/DEAH box helicase [Candidatus Altiarchaeota archaeon]|nr:DEAD/DEAH box helicase [Candidatus Altiarchaeota archaeon]
MQDKTFESLGLIEPLLKGVREERYTTPTQVQEEAIPVILSGRDLIACAQTGTGKTAAFALPLMQLLAKDNRPLAPRKARVLILTPTRELAMQINESFKTYGRHMHQYTAVVYGGVGQTPQVRAMQRGVHVLIATPGRLQDLMQQGHIRLDGVEFLVLDEADRMLDMGFKPDIDRILAKLPSRRQSLLFSATMPENIVDYARTILSNPVRIAVSPESPTVDLIDQQVMFVDKDKKISLLLSVINEKGIKRALVFTRTKHMANRVAEHLAKNKIPADAIHGNKSQNARTIALDRFKSGRVNILVATDVAARGIDVDDITHVINYEIPDEAESYIHRIGRTARAGQSGTAISFCEAQERTNLNNIQYLLKKEIPVVTGHSYHSQRAQYAKGEESRMPQRGGGNRGYRNRSSRPQNRSGHGRQDGHKKGGYQKRRRYD